MKSIFILIPSLSPVGPVKGAIALANALVSKRRVALVVLKLGSGVHAPIDAKVEIIPLYEIGGWFKRLSVYKKHLKSASGKEKVASISSCFSADVFNLFCRGHAIICSSIRGNLPHNYRLDYGWKGSLLATFHLFLVRGFHYVVTMTESMSKQVAGYLGRTPEIIGNFVDEEALEKFRRNSLNSGALRFVFVGSLSARKRPLLIIEALEHLNSQGYEVRADFIGDGPLKISLEKELDKRGLGEIVRVHGHLNELHHIVSYADVFVLPSTSEGVSRACLEALCLGVPAVLRDVDGNSELIETGVNGFLFKDDSELSKAMLSAADMSRKQHGKPVSLLPPNFSQSFASEAYLDLVENHND
jgi:glycosyltransferase involved in cell wall biosynthesis